VSVDVVVFGVGFIGAAVCEAASRKGLTALGVVRSEDGVARLRERDIQATTDDVVRVAKERVGRATHAIVTFPATASTEVALAPLLTGARAVTYLSTTGVYGDLEGVIDDRTPLPARPSRKYAAILDAEQQFRAIGGCILRSPGIYGRERGVHVRLKRGDFKLSGDGSRYGSRIHVEDLAELLLASAAAPGETFVVGDLEPCPQRELVAWLCQELCLPFPASAPLDEVHETRCRNRRIDPSRALARLGISLRYPTYREGLKPSP